jgi:hypothetical protein
VLRPLRATRAPASAVKTLRATSLRFGGFVFAGFAAGFAIHQAVIANANIEKRLTQYAKLLAVARTLRLVALQAAILGRTGCGAHRSKLPRGGEVRNMTLVTPKLVA